MKTALYRLFSDDGALLYVGIARTPKQRMSAHARLSTWFSKVRKTTVEWFSSRELAAQAECAAIANEQPAHNRRPGEPPPPTGLIYTAIRKAKHTQASLAREIDVTPQAVGQWVTADKVPAERAAQVERILGIDRRKLCPDFPWDA